VEDHTVALLDLCAGLIPERHRLSKRTDLLAIQFYDQLLIHRQLNIFAFRQ
jgi:hypothetical protein